MKVRKVGPVVLSIEQAEGVGARVRRSIGRTELKNLDPFLMLDEFRVSKPAGFPDHPHRGFETVTYLLSGVSAHEDFCGHSGKLEAGDLQWMTAGRGVVHAEMPQSEEPICGLQLWVNLRKADKMVEPQYQELKSKQIPKPSKDGVTVAVISGEALGVKSKIYTRTPTTFLDFRLSEGAKHVQPISSGWTAFIYTLSGSVHTGPHLLWKSEQVLWIDYFPLPLPLLASAQAHQGRLYDLAPTATLNPAPKERHYDRNV
ncbi:pirin isoform X2 [Astyanax mexicanus]|uniref:pirin isoform X2 n=1 Tax=Astyanax mexicanus TaxID=7994 RepID=UPI0020CB5326|nr:pirin isoform X2 [Astyanax mexicanus]